MKSTTFEQLLELEKQQQQRQRQQQRLQDQTETKQRVRERLETLRPGLLQLLHESGIEVYALGEMLYVRQDGRGGGQVSLQQLAKAQQQSQVALLEQIQAIIPPKRALRLREWVELAVLLLAGVTAATACVHHLLSGKVVLAVGFWVGLMASAVGLSGVLGPVWPQLRAYYPWKLFADSCAPEDYVRVLPHEQLSEIS